MPLLGELSALITAILWSGTSLVFTSAILRVGSTQVNITRMLVALLLLAVTIAVSGPALTLDGTQLALLAASGIAGLVFGDSYLFRAFQEIGPRISMLVMALAPALSSLLAFVWLGESLSAAVLAGMAVTLAGIAIVVFERPDAQARYRPTGAGVLYAFFGALGQAAGLILAKRAFVIAPVDPFVATFVRLAVSVAVLLPVGLAAGRYAMPWHAYRGKLRAFVMTSIGSVIGPYLGISFSLLAVAHTKVGIAATIMATPPIIMLPMLVFVWKERVGWKAWLGAVLAVAGVAVLFLT